MLSPDVRALLLHIARTSIEAAVAGRAPELRANEFADALHRPAGAFVTLMKHEELRGCIGSIHAIAPLYQAVSSSAIAAATRDPRFRPVRADELPHIALEISVMGPIERVVSIEEIEVGRDGLIISRGRNAGLLLPQVATEYAWDLDTFLRQTCVKAGLPPDAWRHDDCRIERFAAEVFGEE